MRSSSFLILGGSVLLGVFAAGCRIEAHTQTQFEQKPNVNKVSSRAWNGESIRIQSDGINPLEGTGGVEVKFHDSPNVEATYEIAAFADDDKQADANAAIADVIQGVVFNEGASEWTITCPHGNAHGTAGRAGSGCKRLTVILPLGSETQPHNLTVGGGNGDVLVGVTGRGWVKNLRVEANGTGDVKVDINNAPGGAIFAHGGQVVDVSLPSDFSAQNVVLSVKEESDPAKEAARIKSEFAEIESGKPYPVSGATAKASTSLDVETSGLLDDYIIALRKH